MNTIFTYLKKELIDFLNMVHSDSEYYADLEDFGTLFTMHHKVTPTEEAVIIDCICTLKMHGYDTLKYCLETVISPDRTNGYFLSNNGEDDMEELTRMADNYLIVIEYMLAFLDGETENMRYFNPVVYKVATDEKYNEAAEEVFKYFMNNYDTDSKISENCWSDIKEKFIEMANEKPFEYYSFAEIIMGKIDDWFRNVDNLSSLGINRPDLEKYFSELKGYHHLDALLDDMEFWNLDDIVDYVINTYC